MFIINFSHPITQDQIEQIEQIAKTKVTEVIDIPSQIDQSKPFVGQAASMANAAIDAISKRNGEEFVINLPGLSLSASLVTAILLNRVGSFHVLRMRSTGTVPPRFEVAEIIYLI